MQNLFIFIEKNLKINILDKYKDKIYCKFRDHCQCGGGM